MQNDVDDPAEQYVCINCVPGGLLFLSPVMYPKYKCSISEDDDDDDDDDDDEDAVEEDSVQLDKNIFLLIVSRGVLLFLSPTPKGGYPLRLTFCQDLQKLLVRKRTIFRPSLSLSLSLSRKHRKHVASVVTM